MKKVWALFAAIICVTCSVDHPAGTTDETNSGISGKVFYNNGGPVADAALKLFRDSAVVPLDQSTTEPDGSFLFDALSPGTYSVWAEDMDSLAACATIVVPPRLTVSRDLTLNRGSSLTVYVRLEGGENPNTVSVQILGSDRSARADTTGTLTLRKMAKGDFSLRFSTSVLGYPALYRQISLDCGVEDTLRDTVVFTLMNPFPTNKDLYAIACGNGRFVAVGQNGTIIASTDGINWSLAASGGHSLNSIAWGNNRFVAVGDSCGTMTSEDGANWSSYTLLPTGSWKGEMWSIITFGNNQFVASGCTLFGGSCYTVVFTSSDGLSWKKQSFDQSIPVEEIAYGNSTFVGVGESVAVVSTDGTNWSAFTMDTGVRINKIIWGGNQFFAFGPASAYTSPNGRDWTRRDVGPGGNGYYPTCAVWYNGLYSVVYYKNNQGLGPDTAKIAISSDGLNWQTSNAWTLPIGNYVYGIYHGGDKYIAVGRNGFIISSMDGTTWQNRSYIITSESLNDICWNGWKFVAVGWNGTIISSSDGTHWRLQSSGTKKCLKSIVWGNNLFVTVGMPLENPMSMDGTICTSPDGSAWSLSPVPLDYPSLSFGGLSSIAWGNGRFVATGGQKIIISSENGKTWNIVFPSLDTNLIIMSKVAFGKNGFVVVNNVGEIYFSPDGLTWSLNNTTPLNVSYSDVEWGDDKYVAIGNTIPLDSGNFFTTSTDGRNWSNPRTILQHPFSAMSLVWGANQFVLFDGSCPPTHVYSADGVIWSPAGYLPTDLGLTSCAWNGTKYVFVGWLGTIATGPAF
jgi:hypothetical protein